MVHDVYGAKVYRCLAGSYKMAASRVLPAATLLQPSARCELGFPLVAPNALSVLYPLSGHRDQSTIPFTAVGSLSTTDEVFSAKTM